MSTRLNLSDAINMAYTTGQNPTFEYEGNIYTFSPEGIITFVGENLDIPEPTVPDDLVVDNLTVGEFMGSNTAVIFHGLPTTDPGLAGYLWNNEGVLQISDGMGG